MIKKLDLDNGQLQFDNLLTSSIVKCLIYWDFAESQFSNQIWVKSAIVLQTVSYYIVYQCDESKILCLYIFLYFSMLIIIIMYIRCMDSYS